MMLIELLVLCRLAVGVKVALQILPSVVSCLRLLTEPLGISKVSSLTLLTISLKVTVTVAVSPAARWVLSNVALMGTGSLVSIAKLLLGGLTVAGVPVASRMGFGVVSMAKLVVVGVSVAALPVASRMVLRLRRLMVLVASSTSGPAV